MTTPPFRLRRPLLICLLLAWPHFAGAQPAAAGKAQAAPALVASDDTLRQWIRDDHQLIDGILASLTHIDRLVGEIQQMVIQLPDLGQLPPPAAAAVPALTAQAQPPAAEPASQPLGGWAPQLAGAGLLALLAFWLGRQRGLARSTEVTVFPEMEPGSEKRAQPAAAPAPLPPAAPAARRETAPAAPAPAIPAPAVPAAAAAPTAPREQQPSPAAMPNVPAPQAAPTAAAEQPPPLDQSDQALELADIMLSMGLGQGAMQTLTEQIRNEPKHALRHWLKLLDIYRKNGQQQEFERSAEELRQHFNVHPEDWQAAPGAKRSLEEFPHIARRLTELWGKPDCLVYMRNLLDDNRGGSRSGFPQAVAEELLLLNAVMRRAHGLPAND